MLLAEPPRTQGDIHFRLLGIPVRIHPFFWLVTLVLGLQTGEGGTPPALVLTWMVAVFLSILIHELGHALLQMRYGGHPRIILYGMGGLAASEDCDQSTSAQILISLAGPGAGFCFAVVVVLVLFVTGHQPSIGEGSPEEFSRVGISILGVKFYWAAFPSVPVNLFVADLLWINVLWGLVNLLPIYPLDGGRISRELCLLGPPREGMILSLQISLASAILMAVVGLFWHLFITLLFGYLAYSSYKMLEAYRSHRF